MATATIHPVLTALTSSSVRNLGIPACSAYDHPFYCATVITAAQALAAHRARGGVRLGLSARVVTAADVEGCVVIVSVAKPAQATRSDRAEVTRGLLQVFGG